MGVLNIPVPAGGDVGDVYLIHARSERFDQFPFPMSVDGCDTLDPTSGASGRWDALFVRAHDGDEPAMFAVDGLESSAAQAQCFLIRGAADLVYGGGAVLSGNAVAVPTFDIPAVTTTVDNTLVLVGFTTYDIYTDPAQPTITAGTVDDKVVLEELNTVNVWALAQAAAGDVGPWTVDRTGESTSLGLGGSSWVILAQPAPAGSTPTIEAITVAAGMPTEGGSTQPPPVLLTNPHNPAEQVWIGGATQAAQDAGIAAQLAEWDAEAEEADDADGDFYAFAATDREANLAWLAAHPDWDPQTVALTQQITRIQQAILDAAPPTP